MLMRYMNTASLSRFSSIFNTKVCFRIVFRLNSTVSSGNLSSNDILTTSGTHKPKSFENTGLETIIKDMVCVERLTEDQIHLRVDSIITRLKNQNLFPKTNTADIFLNQFHKDINDWCLDRLCPEQMKSNLDCFNYSFELLASLEEAIQEHNMLDTHPELTVELQQFLSTTITKTENMTPDQFCMIYFDIFDELNEILNRQFGEVKISPY